MEIDFSSLKVCYWGGLPPNPTVLKIPHVHNGVPLIPSVPFLMPPRLVAFLHLIVLVIIPLALFLASSAWLPSPPFKNMQVKDDPNK